MGRSNSSTAVGVSDSDQVLRESIFGGSFGGKVGRLPTTRHPGLSRLRPNASRAFGRNGGSADAAESDSPFEVPNLTVELGKGENMRVGIATDHGGLGLKRNLMDELRAAGHEIVDFGADDPNPEDDYPDTVIPLARAVAAQKVDRGIAICGSGVGASVCANKVPGVRAGLVHDHFSARQGVQDDHMNIICMGGRTVGPAVAWDLVQTFLTNEFSQAERHLRRLGKVASLEAQAVGEVRKI
jgi:ribose 5-phosphate isomerase B